MKNDKNIINQKPYEDKNKNRQTLQSTNDDWLNSEIIENQLNDLNIPIYLSNKIKLGIYLIYVLIYICSAFDGGIIPAAKEKIINNLNANDEEFGLLGSLDYFGRIIGSVVFTLIINKWNRKNILIFILIVKAGSLAIVWVIDSKYLHYLMRTIAGFCKVFLTIYIPIWCHQYGPRKKRTMMISIIQIGYPLGVVSGYGLYIAIQSWKLSFVIQGICILILGIIVYFVPAIYFSNTLTLIKGKDNEAFETNQDIFFRKSLNERLSKKNNDDIEKVLNPKNIPSSFCLKLSIMLCNMVFVFTGLSNSVVNFVTTVIQFWGPDYYEYLFKDISEIKRFFAFGIVCITSPILGIVFGGLMGTLIGGYTKKKAIFICLVLSIISSGFAISISYMKSIISLTVIIWLFLFFASGMIPIETGVIISSLPVEFRGDGFSVMNFILNLIGNMPPSWIFGKLRTIFLDPVKAMEICMYYNVFGVLALIIATIFQIKKKTLF